MMVYAIMFETDWGTLQRYDVPGTRELEYLTDGRIINIYSNKAKEIYKVYPDSSCIRIF